MKLRHIIILIILAATTIFACNDTVYPDPMKEPVKMAIPTEGKSYPDESIIIMSDGTIVIDESEFDEEVNRYTAIKKN